MTFISWYLYFRQVYRTAADDALAQELAVLYSQVGRQEEALALLFTILKRDLAFGDAKKIYLDVLATMGAHPAAQSYRRKLYSLLY